MISGGESIYGKPFKDEFHSRLRFVRRGLVAMANAGKDDNASQFFFTMASTPELQDKHTIFGKVVGDTIYNMIRLQEGLVNADEKPETPNYILKTKVLNNPFDDIQPRQTITMEKEKKSKKPKSNMKATKDFGLLSFGDEAEEEEEELQEARKNFDSAGKSSHDLLKDPKLLSQVGEEYKDISKKKKKKKGCDDDDDEVEEDHQVKDEAVSVEDVRSKLKRSNKDEDKASKKKKKKSEKEAEEAEDFDDEEDEELKADLKRREEIQREIKALTREMKQSRKKQKGDDDDEDGGEDKTKSKTLTEEEKNNDMLRQYHEEQSKYASKKPSKKVSKGSSREEMTMKMLEKFKNKLHSAKEAADENKKEDDNDDDVDGDDWMSGSLKFESNDPVLAKDASTKDDDWFDIYDPRNPVNKRRRKEDAKKSKKHR